MDPFIVLGVSPQTTDEEVAQRYQELLRRYPPDRNPLEFQEIRQAFARLRTRRDRLRSRLFAFDKTGRALSEQPAFIPPPVRSRLSREQLVDLLRASSSERLGMRS